MNKKADVAVSSPKACNAFDLAAFEQMVLKGGEVNTNTLPGLIENALALAFAYSDGALVGVGAIKRPYDTHRASVFKKAGCMLNPNEFEFELGWFYVDPSQRGRHLATKLIQALVPFLEEHAAYSTSKTNNVRMHTSLCGAGFVVEGTPYPSEMNGCQIRLFIRRKAKQGGQ